ncbi:hypothetical protein Syun_003848 [Stephania yunnanensis]|uniref:Uncharacterized protein n=1 Tax=Stephania yunnanensis TaxID=152371 RepID=A0AAP0L280_9MAGN
MSQELIEISGPEMALEEDISHLLHRCSMKKEEADEVEISEELWQKEAELSKQSGGALKEVVRYVGKYIKKDEDMKVDGVVLDNYKRARMEIDVEKSMLRGMFIRRKERRYWVDFAHERFKFVCVYRGKITHKSRLCNIYIEEVTNVTYDDKILADPKGKWKKKPSGFRPSSFLKGILSQHS